MGTEPRVSVKADLELHTHKTMFKEGYYGICFVTGSITAEEILVEVDKEGAWSHLFIDDGGFGERFVKVWRDGAHYFAYCLEYDDESRRYSCRGSKEVVQMYLKTYI